MPLRRRWWWLAVASTLVADALHVRHHADGNRRSSNRATVMVGAGVRPNPNSGELYLAQQSSRPMWTWCSGPAYATGHGAQLGMTWLPAYSARQVPGTSSWADGHRRTDRSAPRRWRRRSSTSSSPSAPRRARNRAADFVGGELDALQAKHHRDQGGDRTAAGRSWPTCSARQIAGAQTQINVAGQTLFVADHFTSLLATTQKGR